MRAVTLVALIAQASGCSFLEPLSQDQIAGIEDAMAVAMASVAEREAAWKTGMAGAGTTAVPRADLGGCPIHVPGGRTKLAGTRGAPEGIDQMMTQMMAADALLGPSNKKVVRGGLAEVRPPRASMMEDQVRRLRDELRPEMLRANRDPERLVGEAAALADPAWWTWDLVVVVQDSASPGAIDVGTETFQAGAAWGRSFVYDYSDHRIVCAGEFFATNSGVVTFTSQPGMEFGKALGAAAFDLDANVLQAGIDALVKAGPPKDVIDAP